MTQGRDIHQSVLGAGAINLGSSSKGMRNHNSCCANRLAVNSKRANRLRHLTNSKNNGLMAHVCRYSQLCSFVL